MRKRTLALLLCALLAILPLCGCDAILELAAAELTQQTQQAETAAPDEGLDSLLLDPSADADESQEPEEPSDADESQTDDADETQAPALDEHGAYTEKDDVALYLYLYGRLPENFITKSEARALGWSGGGLDDYAYGKCIGGDHFGNYEGLLPEKSGREYYECDIGTMHKSSRGAKRIIFSNDGLIYYTDDHYESFTLLYGEE